jgi:hypothetical protein
MHHNAQHCIFVQTHIRLNRSEMPDYNRYIKKLTLAFGIFFFQSTAGFASVLFDTVSTGQVTSTREQALSFLDQIKEPEISTHWPNIKSRLFLKNLRAIIDKPMGIYPGKGTNFCGYGALTYLFLQDDPLGYARLLLELYRHGKATFLKTVFVPSAAIKTEAGKLKFKGMLDINPAEQMWYLTLAGHYKGYLNIFNRKYDPGDEDRFWASVNYAKFNRMARNLLQYRVKSRGADLMRPKSLDLYAYISEKMAEGQVVLFINNRIVHKKDHVTIKLGVPTHFIVAEKISIRDSLVTLMYWDYGRKTQMQLSVAFLKRIVFGITQLSKTGTDVN